MFCRDRYVEIMYESDGKVIEKKFKQKLISSALVTS